MNNESCIQTIELLRNLALNIHGVIDVVDDRNCNDIIALLKEQQHTIWELQKTNEYLKDKADRMMRNLQAVLEEREET